MNKKYLKNDILASFVVFLVSVPLCLGIAVASGVAPISGLIPGIVGGILVGMLSKSQISVAGPAAGLVAIVLAGVISIGSLTGFFLAVVLAGFFQVIFGYLRMGTIAYYFPSSVIKGMLAAIGIIIILKQIPHLIGYDLDYEGDLDFFQMNEENTFSELFKACSFVSWKIAFSGILSILVIIVWDKYKPKKLKMIPGALLGTLLGLFLNMIFINLNITSLIITKEYMVNIPVIADLSEIGQLITLPDFSQFGNYYVWTVGVTLALVASLETLLTIEATDKIDPLKRVTPTNRELKVQGLGNMISGLVGGLPITSVIVRSSANVNSGGRTKTASVINGFLILFGTVLFAAFLNKIPLTSLAAILIVTGYKLVSPFNFKRMFKIGYDQFIPFIITIVATVFTDLLIGIGIGMVSSFTYILVKNLQNKHFEMSEKNDALHIVTITLPEEVSFLNKASILLTLDKVESKSMVIIDASNTFYIDYDVLEIIKEYQKEKAPQKKIKVSLKGFKKRYEIVEQTQSQSPEIKKSNTITAETQSEMTPETGIKLLKEGNARFINNLKNNNNLLEQANELRDGQYPFAAILSCIDSRTSAELIFDQGLGDIFSVRIAGNFVNKDILGSLEFACKVAGSKVILVLGHTNCGALKGGIDAEQVDKLGLINLSDMVHHFDGCINNILKDGGERKSSNKDLLNKLTRENVKKAIKDIHEFSPSLSQMEKDGEIKILGGIYYLENGVVEFLD